MQTLAYTSEDIYKSIKQAIVNFEYPPSMQMSENEIAKKFNVSRTPIKSVFTRLESEGFLYVVPQRGTYVTKLDSQKIKDYIYMRLVLEVDIVSNFLKQVTQEDIDKLEQLIKEQQDAVHEENFIRTHFFEQDVMFHGYIFDKIGHLGIWAEIQKLQVNYTRFRILDITQNSKLGHLIEEHVELFDAIKTKDVERYTQVLKKHLQGNFEQTISSELKEYFI